jgi:DNA-binding winged helix-turn-helix (wHTH) protein
MLRLPATESVFEFGGFRFEPGDSRLSRAGVELHAQPKALRVLAVLVENAGSLVDHDALFDIVWERVAVTPGALTRVIRELRRLLDDDAGEPRSSRRSTRAGTASSPRSIARRLRAPLEPPEPTVT